MAVLGYAVMFLIAARTAGVTAPVSRLLPLALLAMLAMVLPSIGGWGPREGATAWVFAAAGLGAGRGAATAVAYGVMVLAASLPGGLVLVVEWLAGGGRWGRPPARKRRRCVSANPYRDFSATTTTLRTRPRSNHSTHSRWPASRSSSPACPMLAAMAGASAEYAFRSDAAVAPWAALQSRIQRTTEPGPLQQPAHGRERRNPHRAGVGHPRSLRGAQRPSRLHREGKPAADAERGGDLPKQRLLVREGEHGLEQQHHVVRAARHGRHIADLEPARQATGLRACDPDRVRVVIDPQVAAHPARA